MHNIHTLKASHAITISQQTSSGNLGLKDFLHNIVYMRISCGTEIEVKPRAKSVEKISPLHTMHNGLGSKVAHDFVSCFGSENELRIILLRAIPLHRNFARAPSYLVTAGC